jgi:amidase
VTVSPEGLSVWFETFRTVQAASIWANHGDWITRTRPRFGPGVRERFAWASRLDPAEVAAARARHGTIRARLAALLSEDAVLCLPTSPRVAPRRETPVDDLEVRYRHQAMHLLCVAGLGGLPQVSLPVALLDGLPLGLSLVGAPGADLALLELARRTGRAPGAAEAGDPPRPAA